VAGNIRGVAEKINREGGVAMFRNPRWMALIAGIAGIGVLLIGALGLKAGDITGMNITYVVVGAVLLIASWGYYMKAIKTAPDEKTKKEGK